jgi:translation initiation factor 2D
LLVTIKPRGVLCPRRPYQRGSDVKKLRKSALEVLGPSVSEEDLNAILPSKADVQLVKMSNKAIVFTVANQPLFFDPDGKGHVFPTVYTLWAFPAAVKSLLTFSEVSPKVLGGADLMLPGVIVPPAGMPEFAADEMMVLRIPENPYPFAVGEMQVDSATATGSGMKGRGLKVLHHFPDPLWAMGDKSLPCDAFRPERVFPLGADLNASTVSSSAAAAAAAAAATAAAAAATAAATAKAAAAEAAAAATPPTAEVAAMGIRGDSGGGGGLTPIDVSSPAGMDAMFERCFMAALDKLTDAELPVRCELFYANVLSSRPDDVTLDLKKSTFKKQAKIFSVMEKRGLITCKAIHKQDNVVSVNRDNKVFLEYCAASEAAGGGGTSSTEEGGGGGGAIKSGGAANSATFDISNVYRASTVGWCAGRAGVEGGEKRPACHDHLELSKTKCDEPVSQSLAGKRRGVIGNRHRECRSTFLRIFQIPPFLPRCLFSRTPLNWPGLVCFYWSCLSDVTK